MVSLEEETIDSSKDMVGVNILVPSIPPALNNFDIVTIDGNVAMCLREKIESVHEELKSDGFGPSDVVVGTSHALPFWVEFLCMPPMYL